YKEDHRTITYCLVKNRHTLVYRLTIIFLIPNVWQMTHWQSFSIIFQTRLSIKDEIYDKAVRPN
ncbi:TPA: hypothetical protein ACIFDI_001640, partial [Acinetobacter baumannii]